eukprot:11423801-Alexandrium_andersonii.AAC.1
MCIRDRSKAKRPGPMGVISSRAQRRERAPGRRLVTDRVRRGSRARRQAAGRGRRVAQVSRILDTIPGQP